MNTLVLQTDFGLVDGAVSAMHGVAKQVNRHLEVSDLTHEIPQYDIWSASYRLIQTVDYWPKGTVFVSVVDPGVGSHRRSVGIRTVHGQIVITPDNGTLTHLIHRGEVAQARNIDEVKSRLPHSQESHTFHGRDIYAYNGARLASGEITFEELGEVIDVHTLEMLPIEEPARNGELLSGTVDILDIRFGSLWTNIPLELLKETAIESGDYVFVSIRHNGKRVYQNVMQFVRSFAQVEIGEPLVYVNSLTNLGVAVNQDSFSKLYNIGYGSDWKIQIKQVDNIVLEQYNIVV
ncbi:S-adenosyl-l-methionine hydroxide adenosyltransferase family protein [Aerococcaceae bacterium NML210727]|nr:S-adenosyl-l-methionine hydroxide adenosyltransferase family protein [Aerococcaceae bacterium NML210727]